MRDEPERTVARDSAAVTVPSGRPVVASELAVLEGVDAAAKAAQEIVAVDHAKYDAEVEAAAELMTADFEKQYRKTAGDIEERFVAQETVVQVNVVAQGVVRANRTELEALVFLNQVVSRVRDGEPETVVTPFKVLVTMVHTDQGWLVDGLETDEPQDKKN
jgi:Mce-associated membrane protein